MRAVVKRGQRLELDRIVEPVPDKGQVLVRTLRCGICGSDLHALRHMDRMVAERSDGPARPLPDMVMGHEFCAEVLDYGPDTPHRLKPGTRVVSVPVTNSSKGYHPVGYSPRAPGGFAEMMLLDERLLLEVPNGLSDDLAALTEPFAVGAHAVAKAALEPGSSSLVIGCGPVGLAIIAALKIVGKGPVIAADFSPRRRAEAERMGADVVVDPALVGPHTKWADYGIPATEAEAHIARMAGQVHARPIVFECVGVPGMVQRVIEDCPPGAQIVVAGVCMEPDTFRPSMAITKQLNLEFVYGYSPDEFAATLRDIAEGRIDGSHIITGTVGLEGVPQAFEDLGDPENHVKIMVDPTTA